MDIIEKLAKNVLETKYEDLPSEAIEATRKGILDTLGCIIAGASRCKKEVEYVREIGGREQSSILIHGGKIPATNAAWVNSVMAYEPDYDGDAGVGNLHDLVCTVPTALAAGELKGGISGKELLTAVAAGEDLAIRICIAGKDFNGFNGVGTIMVFGTAAIASRILNLNLDKTVNAMGFAFVRGAGTHQVASDKTAALRMLSGWSCRSGIEAALLASKGLAGVTNVMQGNYGFLNVFPRNKDIVDLNALTDDLGKRYEVSRLRFKYYPCCGTTHSAVQAALNMVHEHNIEVSQINRVTVETSEFTNSIAGQPLTFRNDSNPESPEAQFSLPYTVGSAIIRKSSKLEHFTAEYIGDRNVIEMANKVNPVINQSIPGVSANVIIEMQDSSKYSNMVRQEENRMLCTPEEVKQKFMQCVDFSGSFPTDNAGKIIDMVDRLEKVEDISELIRLLA